MPRPDLPSSLGSTFSVAEANAAGVTRSRLRASDLESTFHGARAVIAAEAESESEEAERTYPRSTEVARIHQRARHYTPVMAEGAFFSHITAAVLWDAPLPNRVFQIDAQDKPDHPVFDPEVLEVSVFWPSRAPRGHGVSGHAIRPGMAWSRRHPVSELLIASPATTWVMLGGKLPHPYDLVAVADHFVRVPRAQHGRTPAEIEPPLATLAQLAAALGAGRREGAAELRAALARARTGARSRTETWTRLTIVDAGLPEPVLDLDVFDDHGTFLGCVDMAYPQWRIAIEYEGVHHSSGNQWESDVDRYARLEEAGWRVIRVTRRMLFRVPEMIVQRVRAAIADRAS